MRGAARKLLLKEERISLTSASTRDRQAIEGKRLVQEARHELEKLERKIFQGGKSTTRQTETVLEEEAQIQAHPETPTPPPQPLLEFEQIFNVLKEATGGTSVEEVRERFRSQKNTTSRLSHLRAASETEKRKLEKRIEALSIELERQKYAEVKDAEK